MQLFVVAASNLFAASLGLKPTDAGTTAGAGAGAGAGVVDIRDQESVARAKGLVPPTSLWRNAEYIKSVGAGIVLVVCHVECMSQERLFLWCVCVDCGQGCGSHRRSGPVLSHRGAPGCRCACVV